MNLFIVIIAATAAAAIAILPFVLLTIGIVKYVRRKDKTTKFLGITENKLFLMALYLQSSLGTLLTTLMCGEDVILFWVYNLLCMASVAVACLSGRRLSPQALSVCAMFVTAGIAVNVLAAVLAIRSGMVPFYVTNIAIIMIAASPIAICKQKRQAALGARRESGFLNRVCAAIDGRSRLLTLALLIPIFAIAAQHCAAAIGAPKGTFTDGRDGKEYKTVKIGRRVWMAENLNVAVGCSWCYKDLDSNCAKYGRLYDWETAMTACPDGWHLPSNGEWDNLMTAAGGAKLFEAYSGFYHSVANKLKSKTGWDDGCGTGGNGMDVYGFEALPGGIRHSYDARFLDYQPPVSDLSGSKFLSGGSSGYFWSATEKSGWNRDIFAYSRRMNNDDNVVMTSDDLKENGLSVRCVMGKGRTKGAAKRLGPSAPPPSGATLPRSNLSSCCGSDTLRTIAYGLLEDTRDGRSYRTVKLGPHSWMAENLSYSADGSYCYDDDESNCQVYGRLYSWEAAMASCPMGWHLPSRGEWDSLVKTTGVCNGNWGVGQRLKSKTGWNGYTRTVKGDDGTHDTIFVTGNGTDGFGFEALPGGARANFSGRLYGGAGVGGNFWSAASIGSGNAYYRRIKFNEKSLYESDSDKRACFSVRCVMGTGAASAGTAPQPAAAKRSFTDERDGKAYKYVKIGKQRWMAENLNFDAGASSWCRASDDDNCTKYGRLYAWNAAKSACPSGWHLPDAMEWGKLVVAAGGYDAAARALRSKTGWIDGGGESSSDTDEFGFSALPTIDTVHTDTVHIYAGFFRPFSYVHRESRWWGDSWRQSNISEISISYNKDYVHNDAYRDNGDERRGNAVRCIKN